ncbi:dna-3-methyladenine glycosylase-like isoform x2 protein [Lasius niger]|uniref:Dna-3-methyladenine glycosylase-like isoform x2 protein n=1 Tax=Lasius niger TaxID=67767 RepID=A0A0J7KQL8_LASNI|nr:dna-3-methyladenine glycosylase-like isoform x2 protein [Lasius niger]
MKKEKEKQMNIVFSFSDDSSEKSEENKLSKSQLSKINILEAEIKELRNYLKVIDKTTHAILGDSSLKERPLKHVL